MWNRVTRHDDVRVGSRRRRVAEGRRRGGRDERRVERLPLEPPTSAPLRLRIRWRGRVRQGLGRHCERDDIDRVIDVARRVPAAAARDYVPVGPPGGEALVHDAVAREVVIKELAGAQSSQRRFPVADGGACHVSARDLEQPGVHELWPDVPERVAG